MGRTLTTEEQLVKNIEDGIRSIQLGLKEPKDTLAPNSLNRLKSINEGLYNDLLLKYKKALELYKTKK